MKRESDDLQASDSAADINAFFCNSIVGGPVSLPLGEAIPTRHLARVGMDVSPDTLSVYLSKGWLSGLTPQNSATARSAVTRHHRGVKAAFLRHAPWISLLSLLLNIALSGALIAYGVLP